jgi:hypothetical protein
MIKIDLTKVSAYKDSGSVVRQCVFVVILALLISCDLCGVVWKKCVLLVTRIVNYIY